VPQLVVVNVLRSATAQGKSVARRRDVQRPVRLLHHCEDACDFGFELIRRAKHMAIVERHLPDTRQASDHAGTLVTKHGSEFGEPHWQISDRAALRAKHEHVMRTVHGAEHDVFRADLHRRVHVIAEVFPVP